MHYKSLNCSRFVPDGRRADAYSVLCSTGPSIPDTSPPAFSLELQYSARSHLLRAEHDRTGRTCTYRGIVKGSFIQTFPGEVNLASGSSLCDTGDGQ